MDTRLRVTKQRNFKLLILALLISLSLSSCVEVQGDRSVLGTGEPIDSTIRYGRLANGFSYYIKSMPDPQPRTYLRFNQRRMNIETDFIKTGFSHIVEHLAFKSTKNYPLGVKNDERISEFGLDMYDVTATDGNIGTQYMFDVPAGKEKAFNLGFKWFRDIAEGMEMKQTEFDQARGEVLQENLENDFGLDERTDELRNAAAALSSCKNDLSNFENLIKTYSVEDLKTYYQMAYQPQFLSLSVVGNVQDVDKLEHQIKTFFSTIPSSEDPVTFTSCRDEYFTRPPQFVRIEIPADTTRFSRKSQELFLIFRDPVTHANRTNLLGDKRRILVDMLNSLFTKRAQQVAREKEALEFQIRSGRPYGWPPSVEISAKFRNGQEKKAIERMTEFIKQIQRFGPKESEWKDIKQKSLKHMGPEQLKNPRYWIEEIWNNFTLDEPLPTDKLKILRTWLSDLSLKEFNGFLAEFLGKSPEDLVIMAPKGHDLLSYNEISIRSLIEKGLKKEVYPFQVKNISTPLLSPAVSRQLKLVKFKDNGIDASGGREVVLENGLKVILKPYLLSGYKKDEITIQGFSPNGANCFPEEDYYSVMNAPKIVINSGVNGYSKYEVAQLLSDLSPQRLSVSPYIVNNESGIRGEGAKEDVELMLQMIYLYFTAPNTSKEAFEKWKIGEYESYRNPSYSLMNTDFDNAALQFFGDRPVNKVMEWRFLSGSLRLNGVQRTKFSKAIEAYHKLFGNGKDFTFVISGDFNSESILPLLQKYLGNLPNKLENMSCDQGPTKVEHLPEAPVYTRLPSPDYTLRVLRYAVYFAWEAENRYDWKEQLKIKALAGVINMKNWDLRYKKNYSIYSTGAYARFNDEENRHEILTSLNCFPEEFSALRKEFRRIFSEVKEGKISEEEFAGGMKRMKFFNSSEGASLPRVMNPKLYRHYRYGQPWVEQEEVEKFLNALSIEDLVSTANKYLKEDRLYEFYMKDKDL